MKSTPFDVESPRGSTGKNNQSSMPNMMMANVGSKEIAIKNLNLNGKGHLSRAEGAQTWLMQSNTEEYFDNSPNTVVGTVNLADKIATG